MEKILTSSNTEAFKIVVMALQINPLSQRNLYIGGFSGNKMNINNQRSIAVSPAASTASSSSSSSSSSSFIDSAVGASPLSNSPSPSHITKTEKQQQQQEQQLQNKSSNFCCSTSVTLQLTYTIIEFNTNNEEKNFITNTIDISIENVASELINLWKKINESNNFDDNFNETKIYLAISSEEIRQIIYPLFAATKTIKQCTNQKNDYINEFKIPKLFHSFIPINVKIDEKISLEERLKIIVESILKENANSLLGRIETINQNYVSGVCCDLQIDSSLIVRTRGLPWQASDQDIAFFFIGLNISPGGIALCLSSEGRRNGEALIRFDSSKEREFALRRNRKFLNNRYIEVYRGTGEDFMRVAVGADLEALRFVSRDAAMIIRMRGLPFQTTEQQIREFFASPLNDEEQSDSGIVPNGGILFVNRPDGRPSGDAFVLFSNENAGRRALTKHKHRIGTRYVELFRSTQAEVQQLFNRTLKLPQQQINTAILNNNILKRDCVRLRGLPYEAQVQQVVDFLGTHSRNIVFQGVHMIYNNQGHPNGEAFIQMDSECSAASVAQSMHNKYMELGKKKRYIEVFQCSPEDMNFLLSNPIIQSHDSLGISPTNFQANLIHPNLFPGTLMSFGNTQSALPSHLQNFTQFYGSQQQLPINTNALSSNVVYATPVTTNSAALNLGAQANTNNFCLPALTVPTPVETTAGTFNSCDPIQYQQVKFLQTDSNATAMQAANAVAFINLQRQQAIINRKNLASFYSTPIVSLSGTSLPTPALQLNGNFPGAIPYQFSIPGLQYAAVINAATHQKAPFALIHS